MGFAPSPSKAKPFEAAGEHLSMSRAAEALSVTQSAVSHQVRNLEKELGTPLFTRRGRHLELTDTGHLVFGYADDIFRTGNELLDAVRGRPTGKTLTLRVGIHSGPLVAGVIGSSKFAYDVWGETVNVASCIESV